MITIEHEPSQNKYKAVVDLNGTAGAKCAPFGVANNTPHAIGYGYTPNGALANAYETLGAYIYSQKIANIPEPEAA